MLMRAIFASLISAHNSIHSAFPIVNLNIIVYNLQYILINNINLNEYQSVPNKL